MHCVRSRARVAAGTGRRSFVQTFRCGPKPMGSKTRLVVVTLGLAFTTCWAWGQTSRNTECAPFDHTHLAWDSLLKQYTRDGWVDYARLKTKGEESLNAYLASLESVCLKDYQAWSRSERLAFWINAYNAYTIKLILNHYPVRSIRSIGLLPLAAFRTSFIPIKWYSGKDLSLNDIENGILRDVFQEPRIHFSIVCASKSCPALRSESFRGKDLERQLEEAARDFIRDPAKNRFDPTTDILYLSKIFQWFKGDFAEETEGLRTYVARYLDEPAASRLSEGTPEIRFMDYDWSLNGA